MTICKEDTENATLGLALSLKPQNQGADSAIC